jgi:hypothetical protein
MNQRELDRLAQSPIIEVAAAAAEIVMLRNLVCSLLFKPMTEAEFAAIRDEALKTMNREGI